MQQLVYLLLKVLTYLLIRCSPLTAVEGRHFHHGVMPPTSNPAQLRGGGTSVNISSPTQAPSPQEARLENVNGTLDPSQAQALHSLGIATGPDPCNTESHHTLICDRGVPYRHLLSLHLEYCTEGAILPSSAWLQLSSLQALNFEECPARPFHVPLALAHSLESLTIIASFGRSVSNVMAPPLPGSWLGSFYNLVEISVSDVQVNASGLHAMVSGMKNLQRVSIMHTNLRGVLPSAWPSERVSQLHLSNNELGGHIPPSMAELAELQSLDLSFNGLQGELPEELGTLQNLQYLSLSSNQLSGQIPNLVQNLSSLVYLDLSNNQFSGSIPSFFTNMPNLRYIDMRANKLEGEVPFTESFLQGLNSLKLGGNPGLCYNKSIIVMSVALVEGVMECEREWPAADAPSPFNTAEPDDDDADDTFSAMHIRQRGPNKAIILIALALSCTVGAILTATLLTKRCPSKP
ncbi:hypothetical protein GOP47_0009891 [Adiantum capillus-veneris]|uniref:Uncharacterized protein n=1 Tax=Adiantum capillus-veneris TaxID=13818 RepID=A0A9D4UXV7_ADICA|nr:hypothetical protein GOP47_0009891 [Adiantum capillus-veneris]